MSKANKLYLCNFGGYTFDLPVVNYDDYEKLDNKLDQINAVLDEIYNICDTYGNNGIELSVEKQECILQKIKEVKGE